MISNFSAQAQQRKDPFVKLTDDLEEVTYSVPPIGQRLYNWLRRKAKPGREIEFCLKDFCKKQGATLQWVKKVFSKIVEIGLVTIVHRYGSSDWYKVTVIGEVPASDNSPTIEDGSPIKDDDTIKKWDKSTKKAPSNPCIEPFFFSEDTEISETNRPDGFVTSDFVFQDEEKELIQTLPQAQPIKDIPLVKNQDSGDDHLSAAAAKIESAIGKPLTPALKKLALEATMTVIEDAIAALQEARAGKGARDEVAYLTSAIQREWKPCKSGAIVGSILQSFGVWFDWARSKGIAFGSMGVDGGIQVYTIEGEKSFEEAVARFPMA